MRSLNRKSSSPLDTFWEINLKALALDGGGGKIIVNLENESVTFIRRFL